MTRDLYDNDDNDYRMDAADARAARNAQRCQCSGDMPGQCPGPAACPMCERDEPEEAGDDE